MSDLQALFTQLAPRGPPAKASDAQQWTQQQQQQQQQQQPQQPQQPAPFNSLAGYPGVPFRPPGLSFPPPPPSLMGAAAYQSPFPPTDAFTPPPRPSSQSQPQSQLHTPTPSSLGGDQAASLLSLLRVTPQPPQPAPSQTPTPVQQQGIAATPAADQSAGAGVAAGGHGAKGISAADLVASFMPRASPSPSPSGAADRRQASSSASAENPQDFLLKLLNRQKPSVAAPGASPSSSRPVTSHPSGVDGAQADGRNGLSDMKVFGQPESHESETPLHQTAENTNFTYVNPFDQLEASSPAAEKDMTEATTEFRDPEEKEAIHSTAADQGDVTVIEQDEKIAVKEETENGELEIVEETTKVQTSEQPADKPGQEDIDTYSLWEPEKDRVVPVYHFPLRAFVSITWKGTKETVVPISDEGVMDISRLKKDFDQLDRSLTSASSEYIVYALTKSGGMRIVRQDDGKDRQVFRQTRDRIFHVMLCTTSSNMVPTKDHAVLGVGLSSSVYWATISTKNEDFFEKDLLEAESLIFPPVTFAEEYPSEGQLKTRAKRSSRHPDFFGIGRGKFIYIIFPRAALSPKYTGLDRKVDSEKFFREQSLKIHSNKKTVKDFSFSDDDTVLVSLDKAGNICFWDVSHAGPLMTRGGSLEDVPEVRSPILNLVSTAPSGILRPTSVIFLDKLRAYTRTTAMRYVLVGFNQNHTLQLWDIYLGRPVQELRLPQESHADGICSVAYHPGSCIIVVGHPTRNIIYFIHISAPKYNLNPMSQATYLQRIANKDQKLPAPESTACMSGLRQLSFENKGKLRSLDILPLARATPEFREGREETELFELYVMHSNGVTCLTITKADLGLTVDNKIVRSVDCAQKGLIQMVPLQGNLFEAPPTEKPANGEPTKAKSGKKVASAETGRMSPTKPTLVRKPKDVPATAPPGNGEAEMAENAEQQVEKMDLAEKAERPEEPEQQEKHEKSEKTDKTEKKKKKKERQAMEKEKAAVEHATKERPEAESEAQPLGEKTTPAPAKVPSDAFASREAITGSVVSELQKIEKSLASEISKLFSAELDSLYSRFDENDKAAVSRQDSLLRLVSTSLSDNVEKNLSRIVSNNIHDALPTLTEATAKSIEKKVQQDLKSTVPRVVSEVFPGALSNALHQTGLVSRISQAVSRSIESEFGKQVQQTIVPEIKKSVLDKTVIDQIFGVFQQYEAQRQSDSLKIDQLTSLIDSLTKTVFSMSQSQTSFQAQIMDTNRALAAQMSEAASARAMLPVPTSAPSVSPEDIEVAEIAKLMEEGNVTEGSIRWLQSAQQDILFDRLFIDISPNYLGRLSPLLALSMSAAVTYSLESHVMERLNWLQAVFKVVDVQDPDVSSVLPQIMDVLIQRLDVLYHRVVAANTNDPVLRRIPPLVRWARDLKSLNA